MKLIGNLKKQEENEGTKEGRKNLIEKAGMLLTDDELDRVAGGQGGEPIMECKPGGYTLTPYEFDPWTMTGHEGGGTGYMP